MNSLLLIALLFSQNLLAAGGEYPPEDFREYAISQRGVDYVDIKVSTIVKDDDNCNPYSIIGTIYLLTPQPDNGERPYTYVYDLSLFRFSRGCPGPIPTFEREVVYKQRKQLPRIHSEECGYISKRVWLPKYLNLEVIPGPKVNCKP